jgi:Ca-activated chloride channel homolog
MIVFDASGSMAGNLDQGIATLKPRIDEVRSALAEILPTVAHLRRVGLITMVQAPVSNVTSSLTSSRLSTLRVSSCARSTN